MLILRLKNHLNFQVYELCWRLSLFKITMKSLLSKNNRLRISNQTQTSLPLASRLPSAFAGKFAIELFKEKMRFPAEKDKTLCAWKVTSFGSSKKCAINRKFYFSGRWWELRGELPKNYRIISIWLGLPVYNKWKRRYLAQPISHSFKIKKKEV